ncbi:RNA polymerase sigma factor [Parapedobacter deserti]|uniref:RNA polymerase sigma factor n=1 Tax=Parapedobacter deserti TaxID=1912957 RepID=A0ABV7JRQ4_9SPHI
MTIDTTDLPDDQTLLALLAKGEPQALEALMQRHEARVYRFVQRLLKSTELAEEITQDLFIKLWESRHELTTIESLPAWIFRICRNRALNALKEKAARNLRETHYAETAPADVDGEQEAIYHDLHNVIAGFVDALPPKRKEIFRLKAEQGLSTEEISKHLNISPHTVKNQLSQSYSTLRRMIRKTAYLITIGAVLLIIW